MLTQAEKDFICPPHKRKGWKKKKKWKPSKKQIWADKQKAAQMETLLIFFLQSKRREVTLGEALIAYSSILTDTIGVNHE